MQVYILDAQLSQVPIGVPGQIYISGVGLGRGYHNDPARTAQAFIPNPLGNESGSRLYRTGDRGYYLENGAICFLGRVDQQVKIRGYRIEIGEIEAALVQHPAIAECVVIDRETVLGDRRLVAYIIPEGQSGPSVSNLRKYLQGTLPDYMLPSFFVTLAAFPLNPNGKIDRRALPAPEPSPDERHSDQTVYTPV